MTRSITLPLPSFKTVFLTGLVCCAALVIWWKGEAVAACFSRPAPTIHRVEALDVPPLYVGKPDEVIEFVGEAGESVRGVNAVIFRDGTATFTEAEPPGDWGGIRWRRWHRVRESERAKEAAVLVPTEAPVAQIPKQEGKTK
ncbi:MAG: hypothetical protein KGL39_46190 [Patescibacteria group bacterium]|nr:hypothetical protein [Patescibacteria group bacterium]